jgi:hypothetical protein
VGVRFVACVMLPLTVGGLALACATVGARETLRVMLGSTCTQQHGIRRSRGTGVSQRAGSSSLRDGFALLHQSLKASPVRRQGSASRDVQKHNAAAIWCLSRATHLPSTAGLDAGLNFYHVILA